MTLSTSDNMAGSNATLSIVSVIISHHRSILLWYDTLPPTLLLTSHQTHLKYHSCSASPCLERCWRELCAPVFQHLRLLLNLSNCVSAHGHFEKKRKQTKKKKTNLLGRLEAPGLLSSTTHTTQLKPAIVAPDAIIANALHLLAVTKSDLSINQPHTFINQQTRSLFVHF